MKAPKANLILSIIWVIIALSAVKSVFTIVGNAIHYAAQPFIFWLSLLNLVRAGILLLMSFYMRRIVQSYTRNEAWSNANYAKMKGAGYLALVLVIVNSLFQVGYDCVWALLSKSHIVINGLYVFRRFYAVILTESPAIWVLALSIFLFADMLKTAHRIKAENESFI